MKSILLKVTLLFGIAILYTGCATVISGSSQKVQISSTPSDANITIYDENSKNIYWEGTTPAVAKLPRAKANFRVDIEKEGYQARTFQVTSKGINPMIIADISVSSAGSVVLLGQALSGGGGDEIGIFVGLSIAGVGLISTVTDFVTGSHRKLSPNTLNVRLQPGSGSSPSTLSRTSPPTSIEGALERAVEEVSSNIPAKSRIAIININASDIGVQNYVISQLEVFMLRKNFVLFDRSELDRIRQEQNFGMSGEVDEKTAVSIGKFANVNVIITGRVDGSGEYRMLNLRALDVETGQLVGATVQRF
jgi:hypothetical protein